MSAFESDLNIGSSAPAAGGQGFSLQMFGKPTIVLAHLAFKAAALFFYFFANFITDSFIVQFLLILIFLSMDFWTVKNITGRLLVGLRWWSFVDAEGNNHWKFESAKDNDRFPAMDRRVFWLGLVVGPLAWAFFVTTAFLTFKFEWMIVALLGAAMSLANLYGYLRCRWSDTNQLTSYLSKWAFLNVLRRQQQPQPQPFQQNI
ncbi:unnamed protein product [Caenorhabditis auriculariae]|uniref:Golgi apparatus membrane protein TVP23 homolog n=1 Tax=Caenorhabditis auriculariae TaxID=2777116 RepID=A0A8S1HEC8_9PELO|nr:unnamed protein product [Caenorhabditis auriculariae]